MDALGREVYSSLFYDATYTIDLQEPNGIYLVKILREQKTYYYKIMIQR